MANVTVNLPSMLAPLVDAPRTIRVDAETVRAALRAAITLHPALGVHLFDESGGLREHVLCFHNDANTRWDQSLDEQVNDGDELRIIQAVSGG